MTDKAIEAAARALAAYNYKINKEALESCRWKSESDYVEFIWDRFIDDAKAALRAYQNALQEENPELFKLLCNIAMEKISE